MVMGFNYGRTSGPCFVYAIGVDGDEWGGLNGALKIGIASDAEKRRRELQTGCPAPLSIRKLWKFESEMDAREFEISCHKAFSHLNVMREWFILSVDDVDAHLPEFKTRCADRDEMDDLAALLARSKSVAASRKAERLYAEGQQAKNQAYCVVDTSVKADPRKLTTAQAAQHLGKSASWLNQSRSRGDGPPYYKIGANVFYESADLDTWVAATKRTCVWQFAKPAAKQVAAD
jgi:hypothetical protein